MLVSRMGLFRRSGGSSLPAPEWTGMNIDLAHSGSPLTPNPRPCLGLVKPDPSISLGRGPEPSGAQSPVKLGLFYIILKHLQGEC